jgi:endonuclease YncB( thermonuclease family)
MRHRLLVLPLLLALLLVAAFGTGLRCVLGTTTHVVDGDTFDLRTDLPLGWGEDCPVTQGAQYRVGLIGVDAPQVSGQAECFGKEVSDYVKGLLEGRAVCLMRDTSCTDASGRLLAYVWVDTDPTNPGCELFLNQELIRQGYARAEALPPDTLFQQAFETSQSEARQAGRGLWSACSQAPTPTPVEPTPTPVEPTPTRKGFTPACPVDVPSYYTPAGWMGDINNITQDVACTSVVHPPATSSICVSYQPGGKGWAGIYFLRTDAEHPQGDWGDEPGYDLSGATELTFWARGENGGERVEFKAGGVDSSEKRYHDTFEKSLGVVTLAQEWKQYSIDLSGLDLSKVIGAFAWVASRANNPGGLTFYLSEITYEGTCGP